MAEADPHDIAGTITALLADRGDEKTICPSEVARALAGSDETRWRLLMKPIRAEAVRMADEGLLTVRRKGRIVDPHDFKGVYRLGWPSAGDQEVGDGETAPRGEAEADSGGDDASSSGPGRKASVRPVKR